MSIHGVHFNGVQRLLLLNLQRANNDAVTHALRLSTGNRINKAADDPSGFVRLSSYESMLDHARATKRSVDRASNVAASSQLAVDEIRTQLESIRDLLLEDEDLSLTGDERSANQAEIDAALESINDLSQTESEGKRYLNGSSDFSISGRNSSQVKNVQVYSARGSSIAGSVTSAATRASVTYTGAAGRISGNASFTLTGERGSHSFSVTNNELLTDARDRINQYSHETGITASVSGNDLILSSVDYGAEALVDVDVSSGTFATAGTTTGSDAVVVINGETISSGDIDGNRVSYSRNGTHFAIEFVAGFSGSFSTITIGSSNVSQFALNSDPSRRTSFAIQSLASAAFDGTSGILTDLQTGGTLSGLGNNTSQALRVVDEALGRLARIEGQIEGFANAAVASAESLVSGLQTALEDAIEDLNAIDEDEEEVLVERAQSLSTNAANALSILYQQDNDLMGILRLLAQK